MLEQRKRLDTQKNFLATRLKTNTLTTIRYNIEAEKEHFFI
jgi:hypothetical protein